VSQGVVHKTPLLLNRFLKTLGSRRNFNSYFAELTAISTALQNLATLPLRGRVITILSSNLAALHAINCPKQQSGQSLIQQIYKATSKLKADGNQVFTMWTPSQEEVTLRAKAKALAKQATTGEDYKQVQGAKATILQQAIARQRRHSRPIKTVGEYTRKLDTALPGKHTRLLYNSFKWAEASILAQLRTGMTKLNGYLHRIKASDTDQCACGHARETVEHFLFRCTQWDQHRHRLCQQTETKMGCLSFFLGGKQRSDPPSWKPNLAAVRAVVQYTIATGRLAY
jgi:hypothetical protein